ncbi:MAG: rod shape-determining protein RodA [Elusimicrobiales bacterium]|nr:rod shape-determining protein RodA [Elusimicrobiales bacterium]
MFLQKSKIKKSRIDWFFLGAIAILLIIGTISIFSSVAALGNQARIVRTHLLALPIAFTAFLFVWNFNYQVFQDQWKIVYAAIIIALTGVLFFGIADKGAQSWFRLPFFSVQPSEFARIGLILVMANYLDKSIGKIKEFSTVLIALGISAPVFFLLIKQPDFSAILTMLPIVLIMLFCAGARLFHIFIIMGFAFTTALLPILWTMIDLNPNLMQNSFINFFYSLSRFNWYLAAVLAGLIVFAYIFWFVFSKFYRNISKLYFVGIALVIALGLFSGIIVKKQMKYYQQKRLEVFLSPNTDPKGAGYNLIQAQVAIGSGGLMGKGVFSGTQAKLGFVPERHTDFILAVIGEEMGFVGIILVMGLYIFLMRRIVSTAYIARDRFGYLVNCGIFGMFMVYFSVNFGMLLGLNPVAGVPLPLLSYGGSNLVSTMIAIGITQSIYSRRYALT